MDKLIWLIIVLLSLIPLAFIREFVFYLIVKKQNKTGEFNEFKKNRKGIVLFSYLDTYSRYFWKENKKIFFAVSIVFYIIYIVLLNLPIR